MAQKNPKGYFASYDTDQIEAVIFYNNEKNSLLTFADGEKRTLLQVDLINKHEVTDDGRCRVESADTLPEYEWL